MFLSLFGVLVHAEPAAAVREGDVVVVPPGAPILAEAYGSTVGEVREAVQWTVVEVFQEQLTLERRTRDYTQRIFVTTDALGRSPAPLQPLPASDEDCAAGRCRLVVLAGKTLGTLLAAPPITAIRDVALPRPTGVCRLGPLFRIEAVGLEVGAVSWRFPFGHVIESADVVTVIGEPPPCPNGAEVLKTVIGGEAGPGPPQMGLFVVTPADAAGLSGDLPLREKYDLARRTAVKAWTGDRTFCEDAVRQTLGVFGLGGPLDAEQRRRWRRADLDRVRRDSWDWIVFRHAMMFERYEPEVCERDLAKFVEALRLAARTGNELWSFGY